MVSGAAGLSVAREYLCDWICTEANGQGNWYSNFGFTSGAITASIGILSYCYWLARQEQRRFAAVEAAFEVVRNRPRVDHDRRLHNE